MPQPQRFALLGLALSLAGGGICTGQQVEDRKSADIQVWAIRATTKNKDISPDLKGMAEALKKQFNFTGFKLESQTTKKVDIGKTFSTAVVGGYQVKVTPKKNDGKKVQMQVEVLKGKDRKLNTTFTIDAGKFQLQGGWDLDGGDALIVAVSGR